MPAPKLEVPTELRNLTRQAIEQAEKAFGMFVAAANKSMSSIPHPATEMSKKALSFTEENMKAAFDHAKKVVQATDLQEAMTLQADFLKNQVANVAEQMKKFTADVFTFVKNESKNKF